ncbi:MAG TPA: hypothetical protein VGF86_16455 [Candidatus Tumulicola sp.]|jgi:hypothetical protein
MKLAGLIAAGIVLSLTTPAWAAGTVRIQQSNDTVQTYTNVNLKIVNKTLMLTSADKVSTVVISGGSCANAGELIRCNGGGMSLKEDGSNHVIPFKSATFYFNLTDQDQMLPLSTVKVGPHSVVFAAHTVKGTFITGSGTLDGSSTK